MMPHVPFLKAMKDASSDEQEWQALAAGYLVLRLFDDWVVLGPQRITADMTFSNIFPTVAALSDAYQQERRALQAVLQVLMDAPELSPSSVVGPLLGYAAILENRGAWAVAADVYQTVVQALEFPRAEPDPKSIAVAQIRAGLCWKNAQEYDQATAAYEWAYSVAANSGDQVAQFRARLGLANVARARGDLSGAEQALSDIIEDTKHSTAEVGIAIRPDAYHSRGSVRQARERYEEAIADLYEACLEVPDLFDRELILADIGACASVAGYRDTARDTLEIIALTSRNPLARQSAVVNLIEIAVLDGNQVMFNRWRTTWQSAQCNPLTNAYARLYIARGIERFIAQSQASAAFHQVAEYAEHAGIHQVQFEALQDIERLKHTFVAPVMKASTPVPSSLSYVADALADMRVLAESQS